MKICCARGYQNHGIVAKIMRNADIFLITSKVEGMSNTILEAMASGMAIVAASASSYSVAWNGVNGFIANVPKVMASITSKLIGDPFLRHKVGENARRTMLEKFSADQMFSTYLQLYEKST